MSISFFGTIMPKRGCFMIGLLIFCTYWQLYQSYPSSETSCPDPYSSDKASWEKYKIKFNKHYPDPEEDNVRYLLFVKTVEEVNAHNSLYRQGLVTFTTGINNFADLYSWELPTGFVTSKI